MEAAVLIWLSDRIRSSFLSLFAVGALALGVFRLLAFDNFNAETLICNARLGTYAIAIAVLAATAYFGKKRGDELGLRRAAVAVVVLNILALVAVSREVSDYYSRQLVAAGPWYYAIRYTPYDPAFPFHMRMMRFPTDFRSF